MTYSKVIVVPVYNEVKRFNLHYWNELLSDKDLGLIFVNDGSNDGTKDVLDNFVNQLHDASSKSRVTIINLKKNLGKATAVQKGIQTAFKLDAKPRTIAYLDADGAFLGSEVLEKLSHYEYNEICLPSENFCNRPYFWSSRVALSGTDIDRKLSRHYINRIVMTMLCWGMQSAPYDSQSGFKIFPACIHVSRLFSEKFQTKWLFDLELFIRIRESEADKTKNKKGVYVKTGVIEFPIQSWKDIPGSKLTWRTYLLVIREMTAIYKIKRSS